MTQNKKSLRIFIAVICFMFLFTVTAMPGKALEGNQQIVPEEEQLPAITEPNVDIDQEEQPAVEEEPAQEIWLANIESYSCEGQAVENIYCKKEIQPNICITDPQGNKFTNPKTIVYGGKEYSVSYEGQMKQVNATKLMPYIVKVVLTPEGDGEPTTLWAFWWIRPKILPKVEWSGRTRTLPVVFCNEFNVYPKTGEVVHPEAYVTEGVCPGDEVIIHTFTLEPKRISQDCINALNEVLEEYLKYSIKDTMIVWPTEATQHKEGGYWEVGAIPGGKDGANYTTFQLSIDIPDNLLETMIEEINPASDGYVNAQQEMENRLLSGNDIDISVDGVGMDKLHWFNIKGDAQAVDLDIPNVKKNVPTGLGGNSLLMIGVAFILVMFAGVVLVFNLKRKNY